MDDVAAPPTTRLIEQLMRIARVSALEEMASGFAHELNQPLGAIATFASAGQRMLARPQPLIPQAGEVLRQIGEEAMHAGDGIQRIRKLFRDTHESRSTCSVEDLIAELEPVIAALAERAGVVLVVESRPPLPVVNVDRLRIQHVLFTLVQNAIEASRSGDVPATVNIRMSADRYAVQVSVTDRGIGLSPEHRPLIFRPFFTTKPRGTGLGLASSRATIEAHEGTIGFDDVDGGGTRFWFRLPITNGG